MSVTFEVRIPTYDRPDLLQRALESLQSQTYPHWAATIYDDASSAEEVVRTIADRRVRYSRNHQRLGASANIDQCLSPAPAAGGNYGCLLEDDNFWLPEFLARIAQELENKSWPLIQANQRIWSKERGLYPAAETTRGKWFSRGAVEPIYLRAVTLFMQGLSNGGLIWKLDGNCDLRVGATVRHAGLQEVCRSLLIRSQFLFIDDALAVWTSMPKNITARADENNRLFGRGMQSIRKHIIKHSGQTLVKTAIDAAERLNLQSALYELFAHSGYPITRNRHAIKAFLKGTALRLVQDDPCCGFFAETKALPTA